MAVTDDEFLFDIQFAALFHGDEKVRRSAMELHWHLLDFKRAREKKRIEDAQNKSLELQN
ncbi:hypothetical protein ABIF65_011807 [Bradyrhizobium japonicum]|uniref:Uncharacterized protein n=1 Tax=Bradyrhizobium barranii subsp. barranii TaxID=2823807 RepID=A0A939MGF2_9BRAD|nr:MULTISPECIES: hypothetical protein [Bradyrhizobium]MBR1069375.1 hypothetical protein [Bradyrhizobium liaoningense]MDI2077515.1 hypothetical protein [Bradyrhizobium sp. Mp27]UEM17916.1 hypothetical protein J4G43_052835 [Bradyrhizobium barranii subsp. barranii]